MSEEKYPRPLWSHDWSDAVKVSPAYRDGWVREAVKSFRERGERIATYSTGDAVLVISIDENGTMSFRDCRPIRSGYLYAEETLNPDMSVSGTAGNAP